MSLLAVVLAWTGPVVVGAAWAAVRAGIVSIWTAMASTVGPLGLLAVLTGEVEAARGPRPLAAAAIGLAAGAGLYAATAAFMFLFRGWPLLARHARGVYAWREGLPLGAVLAIACLIVAPGEEALWRGVVQGRLGSSLGSAAGAGVGWILYVGANALSGSVPIVLGAAVGGAAWAALAFLTGGVVASILCHIVWTGLMILRPPVFEATT